MKKIDDMKIEELVKYIERHYKNSPKSNEYLEAAMMYKQSNSGENINKAKAKLKEMEKDIKTQWADATGNLIDNPAQTVSEILLEIFIN